MEDGPVNIIIDVRALSTDQHGPRASRLPAGVPDARPHRHERDQAVGVLPVPHREFSDLLRLPRRRTITRHLITKPGPLRTRFRRLVGRHVPDSVVAVIERAAGDPAPDNPAVTALICHACDSVSTEEARRRV